MKENKMRLNLNLKIKSAVLSFLAVMFFLVTLLPMPSYSMVFANYTQCVFINNDQPECEQNAQGSSYQGPDSHKDGHEVIMITQYIIIGAGHFLKGLSGVHLVLNKVELSELYGVNYEELQTLLDNTIMDFEKARDAYVQLCSKGNTTPYNDAVIYRLMDFDYDGFQKSKRLNSDVFAELRSYMEAGDIRGLYANMQSKIEQILKKLYAARPFFQNAALPPVEDIWRINQSCVETALFGQYAAELFYSFK